jgi:hypothetical protein
MTDERAVLAGGFPIGLAAWLLDHNDADGQPAAAGAAALLSWTEKAYPELIHYNKLDKGGHFAAWEQPPPRSARRSDRCASWRPGESSISGIVASSSAGRMGQDKAVHARHADVG